MKKLLITIGVFIFINLSLFAKSGIEAIINVPMGLSVGMPIGKIDNISRKPDLGFDIGISGLFGYMIDLKNGMGVSILGEAGYSYDTYAYSVGENNSKTSMKFHNFQIGILPKFNIGDFAIGLGFGVKVPLVGYEYIETKSEENKNQSTINVTKYDIAYITAAYNYINVIPYLKLTFDYSIFNTHNIAANVGLYAGYEFGVRKKSEDNKITSVDSIDMGLQFGLRFAPSQLVAIDAKEK
ncbi:hypothetical protein [Brachyspira pulli]|uniref:hypothetical protein n=1 Tax=Brachyspira pulli TaxID=310721 RepID=UPI003007BC13